MVLLTVQLSGHPFLQKAVLIKLQKDVLGYLRLKGCGCASKDIKTDIEPIVYSSVNDMIFVAQLLRRAVL